MTENKTSFLSKYGVKDITIALLRALFIVVATVIYAHFQSTKFHREILWISIFGATFAIFAAKIPLKKKLSKKAQWLVTLGAIIVSGIFYGLHLKSINPIPVLPEVASSLSGILFTFVVCLAIPTFIAPFFQEIIPTTNLDTQNKNRFWLVVIIAFVIHIITTLLGIYLYDKFYLTSPSEIPFSDLYRRAWTKPDTDVRHYFNIADNGYVATGDDRLLLVFFPLFPMLLRVLNVIFKDNFISGVVINTFLSAFSAGMMYKVAKLKFSECTAFFAALICTIMPGAIFFNSPMTEPLFLFISLCSFYFIFKREYIRAGIFGALAGLTRSVGILLFAPILVEAVYDICGKIRAKEKIGKTVTSAIIGLLLSTSGTLIYLYINKKVTGNPFMFQIYQKENWHQGIAYFFDTARYMYDYSVNWFTSGNMDLGFNIGVATLVTIFGSLIIYAFVTKKMPAELNIYFFGYFVITMGCAWLLSAVRYISVSIPLVIAIALLPKKRIPKIIVLLILAVLYILYLYNYMMVNKIY